MFKFLWEESHFYSQLMRLLIHEQWRNTEHILEESQNTAPAFSLSQALEPKDSEITIYTAITKYM